MRLIDADKLILHLNDYALQESPSNIESAEDRKISRAVYKAITDCIEAVDEQPTAFDTDKVLEQLEDYLFEKYCIEDDLEIAEIVERGGKMKDESSREECQTAGTL